MGWRWVSSFGVLVLTVAGAPRAAQAGGPLTLTWEAPSTCPSASAIEARVAQLVHVVQPGTLEAHVVITDGPRGSHADVRTRFGDATGVRSLSAPSCESLASAVALVLALILDPELLQRPAVAPPQQSASAPPPPPAPPPSVHPTAPRSADGPRFTVGTDAVADAGTLPSTSVGASFSIGLQKGVAALEAAGGAWGATSASTVVAGRGGRFALLSGALRLCARMRTTWRVGACVGGDIDRVHGESFGVNAPGEATRIWVSPRGTLQVGWQPTSGLAIELALDELVPLSRPTFTLENVGPVYRPAPVATRASFGLRMFFF